MRNALVMRFFTLVAVVVCMISAQEANATVLASDDFEAEGGGTGFDPLDNWGNLNDGVSDTAILGQAFRNLSTPITPFDTPSIFIALDFNAIAGISWGGVSFYEGQDGSGTETLFVGSPGGFDYGINTLGSGTVGTDILINDEVRSIIAEVEFGVSGDNYRVWVDNFNQAFPTGELAIVGNVIEEAWQSVRIGSDVDANQFVEVDNLVIATTAAEVGLFSSVNAVMEIDRATGEIALKTTSGSLANVVAYGLNSAGGGLDAVGWTPIDGRLDTPGGDGSFDDDDWLADVGSSTALAEQVVSETPGDGGTVTTTGVSLGSAWNSSPIEDVTASIVVNDGGELRPLVIDVVYTGVEIASGDLDGDGDIDLQDWLSFKSGQGVVNGAIGAVEAYQMGDLDGNFDHDLRDFDLFVEAFDAANGTGSFAVAIAGVPEPASAVLLCVALGLTVAATRRWSAPTDDGSDSN